MVAGCPKCSARYRVDVDRIGPDGAKLRCTKCSAVFLVRAPKASSEAPKTSHEAPKTSPEAPKTLPEAPVEPTQAPPAAPVTTPSEASASPTAMETGSAGASSEEAKPISEEDRARLVLVADPDEARGKRSAEAIEGWGLVPHLVHDGVEAMLAIQRMLPSAVVLDAALPKMFGFQVCEVVKRNESLSETPVVLVGAIHDQDRYRRGPSDLYGADVYIEQPDLPDGLKPIFEEAGLPLGSSASPGDREGPDAMPSATQAAEQPLELGAPDAADVAPQVEVPEPELELEVPAGSDDDMEPDFEFELKTPEKLVAEPAASAVAEPAPVSPEEDPEVTEERERALRLARIAVSEMLLYSPDKFEAAIRDGNLEQALDLEIQEARALLRQRVSEEIRAETDFIIDELNRVAAERSEQG